MKGAYRLFLLSWLTAGIVTATATVNFAETTSATSVPDCSNPSSQVTSFAPTATSASVFFTLDNLLQGDIVSVSWMDPSGSSDATGTWNPVSHSGSGCFIDTIQIAGTAAASRPGNWKVRILVNASPLTTLSFTISGALNLTINQVDTSKCPTVTLTATVTDSTGAAVSGLGNANFILTEDGQTLPANVTQIGGGGGGSGGLSVALVLDASGSMATAKSQLQSAAKTFVDLMPANVCCRDLPRDESAGTIPGFHHGS
ncbi:MAG TPA: hypothetical protein VE959_00360 [Bryobacteraceae bacterium]|nr:hypothetical protein [Bryobacteraceae bacterium]